MPPTPLEHRIVPYALITVFGLVCALLVVGWFTFAMPQPVSGLQAPTPTPGTAALPEIRHAERLEALRELNGVRLFQLPASPVPPPSAIPQTPDPTVWGGYRLRRGTYGFGLPWLLGGDQRTPNDPLDYSRLFPLPEQKGTAALEFHNSANGVLYMVGFVTPADLEALIRPTADFHELVLFLKPAQDHQQPVAIPFVRLIAARDRAVDRIYVFDLLVVVSQTANFVLPTPNPPLVLPPPGTAPILTARSLAALRAYTGVAPVRAIDSSRHLKDLPNGVYGYSTPWSANTDPSLPIGRRGVDKITLKPESRGTASMEVHIGADGHIYLIGYLSQPDLESLRTAPSGETRPIVLAIDRFGQYSVLVAMPMAQILRSENELVQYNDINRLEISTTAGSQPLIVDVEGIR